MNEKKDLTINENFALAVQNHKKNNFQIAEKLYREVLNVSPDHFESNFLLGTLSIQIKNFDPAKELLQKAIQIRPDYAEAHYNLGLTFKELGEVQNAITSNKKAIKINPDYTEAHSNLGALYQGLEDFKQAIDCYENAIKINPDYGDAYNNLGALFQKLKDFKKAIDYYEKAIQIQPKHANAYNNLGLIFKISGKANKAISCYKKAIKINPNYVDAHNNLGLAFQELGKFDEAINCYEKASRFEPENLNFFYTLSYLKNEILGLNLKDKIIKIISSENCTKKNLAFGNFLLSNYELKAKNYEKEFNYLLKGHFHFFESEKQKFEEEVKYWLNTLPKMIKSLNLNNLNFNIKKNNYDIRPIFVFGVPRSGSTMIEKVIASGEQEIPFGEETGVLGTLIKEKIIQKRSLDSEIEAFQKKIYDTYNQVGLLQEKSNFIFTDKSLDNFFYLGLIKQIFPNAKVINCRRNSLSSIMSIIKNNLGQISWAHNLEHIFKYFDIYNRAIDHFNEIIPGFIYEIEYEKFVNDPEAESKKLLKFCDLTWHKKCLDFYKRKDLISKTSSNIQIRKPIYKDAINKYLPYKQFLNKYLSEYPWFN